MFSYIKRLRQRKQVLREKRQQQGEQIGRYVLSQQVRLAQYLNAWQYRVGFRTRNLVIGSVWVLLVTYFVSSYAFTTLNSTSHDIVPDSTRRSSGFPGHRISRLQPSVSQPDTLPLPPGR